jgi:hypothetical protein
MLVKMVTTWGEEHGLIREMANSVRKKENKNMTPENKAECEKMKKEDNRMVKGRYQNHRGSDERLTKPYMRWAGDPIKVYHLIPGYEYELPMGFINEINSSGLARRSKADGPNQGTGIIEGKDRIHEIIPCGFN